MSNEKSVLSQKLWAALKMGDHLMNDWSETEPQKRRLYYNITNFKSNKQFSSVWQILYKRKAESVPFITDVLIINFI